MGIAEMRGEMERAKAVLREFYGPNHPEVSKPIDEQISSLIDMLMRTRQDMSLISSGQASLQKFVLEIAEEKRKLFIVLTELSRQSLNVSDTAVDIANQMGSLRARVLRDDPNAEKKDKLWEVCTKWIQEHEVSCSEAAYQFEPVNVAAPELVIAVGDVVGYFEVPEEETTP